MEYIILIAAIFIISAIVRGLQDRKIESRAAVGKQGMVYSYGRKDTVMTAAEAAFFHRLEAVVEDRYYIFPQVHLSALLINKTTGKYWKAAFQRINRTSVDYVLCNKMTMQPVYAIELDDTSHDTAKRRARDAGVEQMLASIKLPLLRFRSVGRISDEEIILRFQDAATNFTV